MVVTKKKCVLKGLKPLHYSCPGVKCLGQNISFPKLNTDLCTNQII